jgi:AraC-like DNA-binding protein
MSSRLEFLGLAAAAVTAGTIYVLVHETRRKRKKAELARRDAPIPKEVLLKILNQSAQASKQVVEKIRVEVRKIQQQRNLSDEHAMQLFQQNFEHSLDQLIGAVRNQHQVTEKAMDASFKLHQADPEVKQAIQNMRMLSAPSAPAGAAPAASAGAVGGGGGGGGGAVAVPESLTKHRLKEIMAFNAVMLEKELRPIREQVEAAKKNGQQAQLDPQVLVQVQARISQAVQQRFSVSDEQVMAAVELYGAKNDPGFKDILQRIATTLSTSLG